MELSWAPWEPCEMMEILGGFGIMADSDAAGRTFLLGPKFLHAFFSLIRSGDLL